MGGRGWQIFELGRCQKNIVLVSNISVQQNKYKQREWLYMFFIMGPTRLSFIHPSISELADCATGRSRAEPSRAQRREAERAGGSRVPAPSPSAGRAPTPPWLPERGAAPPSGRSAALHGRLRLSMFHTPGPEPRRRLLFPPPRCPPQAASISSRKVPRRSPSPTA